RHRASRRRRPPSGAGHPDVRARRGELRQQCRGGARSRRTGVPRRVPRRARRPRLADLAARARAAPAGAPAEGVEVTSHCLGLVLGAEDDWPRAFEALTARLGEFEWRGERHELDINRVTYEPFDLRYRPRYALVLDRVGWWYPLPREWLKKVALMDDVYLLNNPFTFQAMEKHSAYCAMMRLGLKVPDTWLVPHKQPPWNERF